MGTFKKSNEGIHWNKLILMNDYNTLLYGRAYKSFLCIKNMPKAVQTSFFNHFKGSNKVWWYEDFPKIIKRVVWNKSMLVGKSSQK